MSTLTDKANALADEAEANAPNEEEEEAEAGEQAQPEPEPEPEQATALPAMTEQQAEREIAKLERAATAYMGKAFPIAQALGMPVQPCPMCAYPGLAIPRQAHEVTSDIEAAIFALIGRQVEPEYPTFAGFKQCDTCKGTGEVMTGAVIERSRHTTCPNPNCGGKGYVTVSLDPAPATPAPQFPGAQLAYTPLPAGVPDAWGRPAGHPHWGLDPAMVGSPNGQQVG